MIKAGELNFRPVTDNYGNLKTGTVGPWACEMYECTGDMQLQAFRKGAGDNLLKGLSMKVRCGMRCDSTVCGAVCGMRYAVCGAVCGMRCGAVRCGTSVRPRQSPRSS